MSTVVQRAELRRAVGAHGFAWVLAARFRMREAITVPSDEGAPPAFAGVTRGLKSRFILLAYTLPLYVSWDVKSPRCPTAPPGIHETGYGTQRLNPPRCAGARMAYTAPTTSPASHNAPAHSLHHSEATTRRLSINRRSRSNDRGSSSSAVRSGRNSSLKRKRNEMKRNKTKQQHGNRKNTHNTPPRW
mgnify:CR=1 FL=1